MHYEINPETFAISFYDGINPEPYQYQPDYPNTDKFDSYEEAETWAQLSIQAHDPECKFFAPIGKGLPGEPKPTETEIAEAKLLRTGLTVEELKSLLGI
jgi:hypothetical protein